MKEVVITTNGLNSYGSRVLTEGLSTEQYEKNPVLLWMHRRCFDGATLPIGRMENLHREGDKLIGTPVFDEKDGFALQIKQKWEAGFLKMASAGIEIVETSDDPLLLLAGQTRPTITKSKLVEVSIVDIGANDDALQLTHEGKMLRLAAGEDNEVLPLMKTEADASGTVAKEIQNSEFKIQNTETNMKQILLALGLSESATEAEALSAIATLQKGAKEAETLRLSAITSAVNTAIAENRITEANRDHFVQLGKAVGIESLQTTLALMHPAVKPTQVIENAQTVQLAGGMAGKSWDELDRSGSLLTLKKENMAAFKQLYKEKFGVEYKE